MATLHKRSGVFFAVLGSGLLTLIIAFSNLTDYSTNFEFVKHILSMDNIFENSTVKYRSITNNTIHHLSYLFIITLEITMSYFFITSAVQMYLQMKNSKEQFNLAKKNAYIGISLGILLWFIGFTVIGGEWFSMWQSNDWNGLEEANRIVSFFMLTYLALVIVD